MTVSKEPHILIVGAGLGGLALAQALRKQGVSFQVFERSNEGHAQGYAIGIHRYVDPFTLLVWQGRADQARLERLKHRWRSQGSRL